MPRKKLVGGHTGKTHNGAMVVLWYCEGDGPKENVVVYSHEKGYAAAMRKLQGYINRSAKKRRKV